MINYWVPFSGLIVFYQINRRFEHRAQVDTLFEACSKPALILHNQHCVGIDRQCTARLPPTTRRSFFQGESRSLTSDRFALYTREKKYWMAFFGFYDLL